MAERRPSAGSSALNAIAQQELKEKYSLQGRTQVAPRVQTMQNARPTVRSALSNLMRDAVDATGLEGGYRQGLLNAAGGVETAADFLPVVGDVLGLEDASRAYGQGDMVGTGINMMGVVPIIGDVASKGAKSALRAIDAYHGSPHEFQRFSMDKIGTGAGQQVYGHGIYFSENPAIARPFSKRTFEVNQSLMPSVASFFENDYSLSKARAAMKSAHPNATNTEIDNSLNEYYMHLDDQGYMYNANLNVEPEDLLDFDAPLSQQPEAVKRAAEFYNVKTSPSGMKEAKGSDVYRAISQARQQPPFDNSSMNAGGPEASAYLNELGIKGIKYKARGEGVSNYVIFDDSLINTKRVNDQLTPSWMNPEARMQRATEQQFLPETVYHGTAGDIRSFDPKTYGGSVTRANSARMGTWFSDNPEVSASYARFAAEDVPIKKLIEEAEQAERKMDFEGYEKAINAAEELESSGDLINAGGQNIIPARVRGKLFEIDVEGATMSDLDDSQLYKWAQEAKEKGFDGLKIKNFSDNADYGTYTPATHYLIFDPKNIRSTNAEFDPTKADSADLLSSRQSERQMSALRGIA